jgi:hypothetical protein
LSIIGETIKLIEILTAGEILVEFMRERPGIKLNEQDSFIGPFVSGVPAIFADIVANLGHYWWSW